MKRFLQLSTPLILAAAIVWYAQLADPDVVRNEPSESIKVVTLPSSDAGSRERTGAPLAAPAVGEPKPKRLVFDTFARPPGSAERDHQLLAIGGNEGIDAALRFIKEKYPPAEQEMALAFLTAELGKRDLNVLLRVDPVFTQKFERNHGVGLVAGFWVQKDPAALLSFIENQTSGRLKDELFFHSVGSLANQGKWDLGTDFFTEMPVSRLREQALLQLSVAYGQSNPAKAAEWAASFEQADVRVKAEVGVVIALQVTRNLDALKAILPGLTPGSRGDAKDLLGKLTLERGLPLIEVLQQQAGQPGSIAPILIGAAKVATKEQIASFLPQVNALVDATERNWVMREFAARMFMLNQQDGVQFALSLQGAQREAAIRGVVGQWQTVDAARLSEWVHGLAPGLDQDVAFDAMVQRLRGSDPQLARKVAGSISNVGRRESLLRTLP